jgi:hypothetical protein
MRHETLYLTDVVDAPRPRDDQFGVEAHSLKELA